MGDNRTPETIPEYNASILSVHEHLHSVRSGGTIIIALLLGMTQPEVDKYDDFYKAWSETDPASPGLYALHSNPKTKTEITRQNVVNHMKEFSTWFRPILVRMSGSSSITSEDRKVLNIAEPVTSHSTPSARIDQKCIPKVKMLGGGIIKISCSPTIDSNRSSKAPGSNGLILAYRVDQLSYNNESAPNETIGKVRRPEFTGPDDNTIKITQTKASFSMELGANKAGYVIQFYLRWINSVHPELNGPWTGPYSEVIS